ncbi:uncharacterized protein J4E79_010690 [Alternaria viburni]|uniref:uncharacterized protein n=1 Tax=Alternaria viburni TaxID=566460 RepID=UPI0020C22709|nr:uncharacterized protein J4E79_010690 [Alternaria viburni]KAI4646181.1 hypothetical protein J4E79_010690 [Alternaria viburni]
MRAAGEGYNQAAAIEIKANEIHFNTTDISKSEDLFKVLKKQVPASLELDSTAKCCGLIQEEYMLVVTGYPVPANGDKTKVVAQAKAELESHFKLKKDQITGYRSVGSQDVHLTTCNLDVFAKIRDATNDFTRPLMINYGPIQQLADGLDDNDTNERDDEGRDADDDADDNANNDANNNTNNNTNDDASNDEDDRDEHEDSGEELSAGDDDEDDEDFEDAPSDPTVRHSGQHQDRPTMTEAGFRMITFHTTQSKTPNKV